MSEFGVNYFNSKLVVRKATTPHRETADGQFEALWALRDGALVGVDWVQALVLEGRVFMASNAAMETARDIGRAAYVETEPAIALDVPAGTIAIPLEIQLEQGGTAASDTVTVLLTVDDKERITSGNAATIRNLRIHSADAYSPTCKLYHHDESATALLVSAPAEDNTFFAKACNHGLELGPDQNVLWSAREHLAPVLEGPASLCVYWYGTDDPEGFWHIIWAEFPANTVA